MYSKNILQKKCNILIIAIVIISISALSIILRYPTKGTYNFYNSDATYHVLLTMKAYDKTPISVHKFLPIVSLGEDGDKHIPWGATLPDKYGNYYYTSFSSAGYIAPYIFVKLFHMPINEQSLFIFSSTLLLITVGLAVYLFTILFKDILSNTFITIVVWFLYISQNEVMHSQGIVYWHHSLVLPLFLIQLIMFIKWNNVISKSIFWILCILIPYTEWGGVVNNIGFAIAFLFKEDFKLNRKTLLKPCITIILTVFSLLIFVAHYIGTVDILTFFHALYSRFTARSFAVDTKFSELLQGYFISFNSLLIITGGGLCLSLIFKESRKQFLLILKKQSLYLFLIIFPLIENILMKQHATIYSFDRLKLVFPLILIFLISIYALSKIKLGKILRYISLVIIVFIFPIQLFSYLYKDTHYSWHTTYFNKNNNIAYYIQNNYNDNNSILGQENAVRGYTNLLFGRGIYEGVDMNRLIATNNGTKRYVLFLVTEPKKWSQYEYKRIVIYDTVLDSYTTVFADNL